MRRKVIKAWKTKFNHGCYAFDSMNINVDINIQSLLVVMLSTASWYTFMIDIYHA